MINTLHSRLIEILTIIICTCLILIIFYSIVDTNKNQKITQKYNFNSVRDNNKNNNNTFQLPTYINTPASTHPFNNSYICVVGVW